MFDGAGAFAAVDMLPTEFLPGIDVPDNTDPGIHEASPDDPQTVPRNVRSFSSGVSASAVTTDTDADGIDNNADLDDDNDGIDDVDETFDQPVDFSGGPEFQNRIIRVGGIDVSVDSTLTEDNAGTVTGDSAGHLLFTNANPTSPADHTVGDELRLEFDVPVEVTVSGMTRPVGSAVFNGNGTRGGLPGDEWRLESDAEFHVRDPDGQLEIQSSGPNFVEFRPAPGQIILAGPSSWSIVSTTAVSHLVVQASGDLDTPANITISDVDTDGDGILNLRDLDSDNDGVSDLAESGQPVTTFDMNRDGVLDSVAGIVAAATGDLDRDGLADSVEAIHGEDSGSPVRNVDGDVIRDHLDLDSDDDNIPDTIEARPTTGYITNDGDVRDDDADADGVIDAYDRITGHGAGFVEPVDTDSDGVPDLIDVDSDADGLPDVLEASVKGGLDFDTNTIGDELAVDYRDPDGVLDNPSTALANQANGRAEVAYRERLDTDGDGIDDVVDIDDDNDGLTDIDEGHRVAATSLLSGLVRDGDRVYGSIDGIEYTFATDGSVLLFPFFNVLYLTGAGLSATIDVTFGAPVDLVSLELIGLNPNAGDLENPISYLSDFSVAPSAVSRNLALVGTGAATQVFPNIGVGSGEIIWSDLGAVDSISFTSQRSSPANLIVFVRIGFTTANNEDGDDVVSHLDLDSDNDGISDLNESGQDREVLDVDNDGVIDNMVGPFGADADRDGLSDSVELANGENQGAVAIDSDEDGIADLRDLDSDADGIADTVEVRRTSDYAANDGDVRNDDRDGDGVLNLFDAGRSHGGRFFIPENTDGDRLADYLDPDSDNDSVLDRIESGLNPGGVDADSDGIDDAVGASYADPDGTINHPVNALADTDQDALTTGDVDYRDSDDDGDGIPSLVEIGGNQNRPRDTDGDGKSDYQDTDSDSDGIPDVIEAISPENTDPDNPVDTDNDGRPDYLDTDSDDDGIPDNEESGTDPLFSLLDTDNDGIPDFREPFVPPVISLSSQVPAPADVVVESELPWQPFSDIAGLIATGESGTDRALEGPIQDVVEQRDRDPESLLMKATQIRYLEFTREGDLDVAKLYYSHGISEYIHITVIGEWDLVGNYYGNGPLMEIMRYLDLYEDLTDKALDHQPLVTLEELLKRMQGSSRFIANIFVY